MGRICHVCYSATFTSDTNNVKEHFQILGHLIDIVSETCTLCSLSQIVERNIYLALKTLVKELGLTYHYRYYVMLRLIKSMYHEMRLWLENRSSGRNSHRNMSNSDQLSKCMVKWQKNILNHTNFCTRVVISLLCLTHNVYLPHMSTGIYTHG